MGSNGANSEAEAINGKHRAKNSSQAFGKRFKENQSIIWTSASLFVVGLIVGRLFPPFVVDRGFFRDLILSPAAAGLFALLAAVVALWPAFSRLKASREVASDREWWKRSEWAIAMAVSKQDEKKIVGLLACEELLEGAKKRNDELLVVVANAILHPEILEAEAKAAEAENTSRD